MTKNGISFSGNWWGPNWLLDRVTTTGNPWDAWWDRAMRSLLAFEAEYGELGDRASPSRKAPTSIDP